MEQAFNNPTFVKTKIRELEADIAYLRAAGQEVAPWATAELATLKASLKTIKAR